MASSNFVRGALTMLHAALWRTYRASSPERHVSACRSLIDKTPPRRTEHWLFRDLRLPRRDAPQVNRRAIHVFGALGLPVTHREGMRDDAGAGAQFFHQFGAQLEVEFGKQVERDHGRFADIRFEQVALDELHLVGDLAFLHVLGRLAYAL